MRRSLLAMIILPFTIVLAPAAAGSNTTLKPGRYSGAVHNAAPIELAVRQSPANQKLVFVGPRTAVRVKCMDGKTRRLPTPASSAPIDPGSQRFSLQNAAPRELRITGKLDSFRASGTYRLTVRLSSEGKYDPTGPVSCDSGVLRWSAIFLSENRGASAVNTAVATVGTYGGAFEGTESSVSFTASETRVKRMKIAPVSGPCSSGPSTNFNQLEREFKSSIRIRGRRFAVRKVGSAWDFRLRGKFVKGRASGTLRITARVNDAGLYDYLGTRICDSGKLSWSARRS